MAAARHQVAGGSPAVGHHPPVGARQFVAVVPGDAVPGRMGRPPQEPQTQPLILLEARHVQVGGRGDDARASRRRTDLSLCRSLKSVNSTRPRNAGSGDAYRNRAGQRWAAREHGTRCGTARRGRRRSSTSSPIPRASADAERRTCERAGRTGVGSSTPGTSFSCRAVRSVSRASWRRRRTGRTRSLGPVASRRRDQAWNPAGRQDAVGEPQ